MDQYDAIPPELRERIHKQRESEIRERIKTDRLWMAGIILANRYTEDQGIDAEMASFNEGLETAARILRGDHQ